MVTSSSESLCELISSEESNTNRGDENGGIINDISNIGCSEDSNSARGDEDSDVGRSSFGVVSGDGDGSGSSDGLG